MSDAEQAAEKREYQKKWHARNPSYGRLARRKQVKKIRDFLIALKKNGKCVKCQVSDFIILEWAHKKPRTKRLGISTQHSMKALLRELKICVLLCRNCHKKKDYAELLARAERCSSSRSGNNTEKYVKYLVNKKYLEGVKKNGCAHCSETDIRVLEFAHKSSHNKKIHISAAHSIEKIQAELSRCLVLCANCHGIKDYDDMRRRAALRAKTRIS